MAQLTLPSEVEPESLADLVTDCRSTRLAAHARAAGSRPPAARAEEDPPHPPAQVRIPDATAALLDGMPEYGD